MQIKNSPKNTFLKKLKPFFNFSILSIEDFLCLIVGTMVFSVVVFQAATINITYDEAYTYMNTGRIQNFFWMYQFRIANTHFLNSLLMAISTLFTPYNDFSIRLPNILSSALYISVALSFSKKFKNPLLVFGLLTLFFFQIYFMSLGRGYGLSVTFILAALFVYRSPENFKRHHIWIGFLFLLAFYANYVAIAPIAATAIFMYFHDFKRILPKFKKLELRWLVGLFVVGLYGFFSVTLKGKPLYGAYDENFFKAIPYDYISLFHPSHTISPGLVSGITIALIAAVVIIFLLKRNIQFGIITLLTFSIIALMAAIGDKPLPTGRVLIPFWPLIVLTFAEILELIPAKKKLTISLFRLTNIVLFAFLIFNFLSQFEFNEILETRKNQWKIPIVALANYTSIENQDETYYIQKDNYHGITAEHLKKFQSEDITNNSDVVVKYYPDLSVITITTQNSIHKGLISGEVWKGDSLIYRSDFPFNELSHPDGNKTMRLVPLPNYEFDKVEILDDYNQYISTINIY